MEHTRTISAREVRRINRSAILEFIRRETPVSRSRIAEQLGTSLPTVMRIVDELVAEGFVRKQETTEWTGGRRRALLEFNAQGHVVIGVDLGGTKMFGAAADLGGNVLAEIDLAQHGTFGDESCRLLVELIRSLLADPQVEGRNIRGIGIGAPGVTHRDAGIVTWAPSLQWRDFPLRSRLSEHFDLPILVDNDVNLAALGELWFGAGQNTRNMVLVAVGTGIGAGVVIEGALYRGAHEASGEVGYLLPGREFLGRPYEVFGALESAASGSAIAERARQVLKEHRPQSELDNLLAQDVFDSVRRGEEWAQGVINETIDYLSIAIANISALYDPEVIILGGGVARSADLLIKPILRRIEGAVPVPPNLVASQLGRRAAVMGAIVNVLHGTMDFYLVRRLS